MGLQRGGGRTVVLTVTGLWIALAPAILVESRLRTAVLGVVALLVVLLILLLVATTELAGLERLSGGLESGSGSVRPETTLLPLTLLVHVELLLRLASQVLVLRSGIILPGVEARHDARWGIRRSDRR